MMVACFNCGPKKSRGLAEPRQVSMVAPVTTAEIHSDRRTGCINTPRRNEEIEV